jgi:glutathione S-transferase
MTTRERPTEAGPRVLRIPFSTNVERVGLAAAHKSVPIAWVDVDPADRSPVQRLSGQPLVPVLDAGGGEVVADSMAIVAWLEARAPDPPLWPADPARRAEVDVFVDWFNLVWKGPPNRLADHPGAPTEATDAALLASWLPRFEALLAGRDFLFGDELGAADVCAFPFLRYGVVAPDPADTDPFHRVLAEHLPIVGRYPRLEAWVRRVDALPRA